ncbi:MAG TPA: universal stress protein [Rhodanobacter sp.]
MFKHILIPVDDDAGSRHAMEQGVELARCVGARITGLHVMQEFARTGIVVELLEPGAEALPALARAHGEKLLAPLQRLAGQAGVPYGQILQRGDRAGAGIVEAAERSRCDLIVMASHGRRGVAKFVLGSETQYVLAHAGVPVLVVH